MTTKNKEIPNMQDNVTNLNNDMDLFEATTHGKVEIVKRFIEENDSCVDDGDDTTCYSPLMAACENGYFEIAQLLLKHGADPNRQYEKESDSDETFSTCQEQGYPLTLAIEGGSADIVRLLLENGADIEVSKYDYDGRYNSHETPLLLALRHNQLEMADLLITNGADCCADCMINGESHTPLTYFIARAEPDKVRWLIEHGADPNCFVKFADIGKANVFMYAVHLGLSSKKKIDERFEIVQLLIKSGVDLSCTFEACDLETIPDLVLDSGNERYIRLFGLQNIKAKLDEFDL